MDAFCFNCKDRVKCKKICPEVEKELKKYTKGKPKWETIVDPQIIDKGKLHRREETGRKKEPKIYSDNWE